MAQAVTAAVCAFVKTPGYSPVKTRLATGIGKEAAAEFYELACLAVAETLKAAAREGGIVPVWAVAETAALAVWPDFAVVAQGEGALAVRLAKVHAELAAQHEVVILIGADCPQLARGDFAAALATLRAGADFAVGPAADGGFYLLASARPINKELFMNVPMSVAETGARLVRELEKIGKVGLLPPRTDVDQAGDLAACAHELAALPAPTAAQARLALWLKDRG